MNPENIPQPQPEQNETSKEKLDVVWFSKFEKATKEKGLSPSTDERKSQVVASKEAFLSGETDTPFIDNREINLDIVAEKEQGLLELKKYMVNSFSRIENPTEQDKALLWAYRWRINEKIGKLRILKASATGDMKRYARYTDYVFGKPEPEAFDDSMYVLDEVVTRHLEATEQTEREAAEFLRDNVLANTQKTDRRPITPPDQESFEKVRDKTLADYENFGIELDESINSMSAERLAEMFEVAINSIGADEAGYTVKIDEETQRTGLMVKKAKREMNIPAKFQTFLRRAKELVNHETNHIDRRVQGERSRLLLFGDGLDRYDQGEEGLGTMQEEAFKDSFTDFPRLDYFLGVAMARGMDGNPRNFRQVFDILENYYTLFFIDEGQTKPEELKAKAQKRAWSRAVNIFRGTDMKTPGVCNTRGMIYRKGNIAIWELISKDGREMTKFTLGEYNRGKYDPANKRHRWILAQCGISDEDLKETD